MAFSIGPRFGPFCFDFYGVKSIVFFFFLAGEPLAGGVSRCPRPGRCGRAGPGLTQEGSPTHPLKPPQRKRRAVGWGQLEGVVRRGSDPQKAGLDGDGESLEVHQPPTSFPRHPVPSLEPLVRLLPHSPWQH